MSDDFRGAGGQLTVIWTHSGVVKKYTITVNVILQELKIHKTGTILTTAMRCYRATHIGYSHNSHSV